MKLPAKPLASGLLFVSGALLLIAALHAPRDGVRPSPMQTWPGTVSASSVGVVVFTAPPDITICFCGSYRLQAEKDLISYYLASDHIDLSKYVGQRVTVTGRPFATTCWGTLLRTCAFLNVESVETLAPLATEPGTWGRIKSLYR